MINTEKINQNQIFINKNYLNNSHTIDQKEQNDLADQNLNNSFNSIGNSITSHLNVSKRIDIDHITLINGNEEKEEDIYGSYNINIDGVNKRRALFSQDMILSNKNKQLDLSEISNNQVENHTKTIQKNHAISSIELFDRSNGNNKYFTDIQQEQNQSPQTIRNNSSLSPRNKKISNNLQLAEQNYESNLQEIKYMNLSERLRLTGNKMQSIQLDSLDSLSQTKFQGSIRQYQSSVYTPKGQAKKSMQFNQSKSKMKQSAFNIQNDKNNEEVSKQKNYFVILSLVQKFIKTFILRVAYKDFNMLDIQHFKMIGDISYFINKKKIKQQQKKKQKAQLDKSSKESTFNIVAKKRENLISYISAPLKFSCMKYYQIKLKKMFIDCKLLSKILNKKTILPDSLYVVIWDFIIILIMLFHLIVIPVQTCFYIEIKDNISLAVIYIIPAICFAIDLLIAFNTGIYEFGVIVMEQKLISRACWRNKFPYHVCLISTILINFKYQNIIIEIFTIFLKLNQFLQRINKINQHFQITFKLPKLSELFKLMALVLFVAHLCGCGFHYVGQESQFHLQQDNTWIIQQKIENENWTHRYIYSIYFAIVTMVTIGYGDIYPKNIYERIYVIFMTLFSCGIFAYAINTIGNIFLEQNYKQKAFQQKLFDIQKYLQSKSINKEAQIRVFKYLEYLNEQSDEILTKGQAILSECSQDLKEEILKDYYGKILQNLKILQNNFSTEFIQALSIKMKEKRFGPGEVIIQQGNRSKNLYFLSNGDIEYYIQNGSKNKQVLALQVILISQLTDLLTCLEYLTFECSSLKQSVLIQLEAH